MSIDPRWGAFAALLAFLSLAAAQDAAGVGRKALDCLLGARYNEFTQLLTPAAKERLTVDFLRDHAGVELKGFGTLEEISPPVSAKSGPDTLISYPVRFSKVKVHIQFTIAESGKVAGLYFRPSDAPLPPLWSPPEYSRPDSFSEREITVGEGAWKLPGTLTVPKQKGPHAAVVLVHGPGPNDRDETIFSNRIFRDLAEGLASRNIVALRYDKRSKVYGARMSETNYTLQEETVEDAVKALALVREQPAVDSKRTFLVAHSLGGYAMPRIAEQDGKLAGAVVLAGNARPIEDVVLDQNEYMSHLRNSGGNDERMQALREEVAKAKALGPGRAIPPVVLGLPGNYLLDLRNYDPAALAKRLSLPFLFLQGQRDMQVTMKDFNRWQTTLKGKDNVQFRSYPALNHLFVSGTGPADPAEYRKPSNVDPEVIEDIVKWIGKH